MDRQSQRPVFMTAGTMSILDKVPKGYTPPLTSGRRGCHSSNYTPVGGRPRTTGTETPGNRPHHEPFLAGAASVAPLPGRRDVPRSRSANNSGRMGRDQRYQQQYSRLGVAEDENDMVGRWDYASSEDHVSAATASGFAAATGTRATAASGTTGYSVGSTSPTLASGDSAHGVGDQQVGGSVPFKGCELSSR